MARLPGTLRQLLPYALIFGLLGGVYLLPPDTSLSEVRKAGVLRACVPPNYPPLVTGDHDAPGIDIELLQALVKGMGMKLVVTPNAAMGQDFNPRNWRVTRAKCEVLGGGVVVSPITKSFLETSPPYAQTGWALVGSKPSTDIQGQRVGVLTGISGLDRLALSRHLRAQNSQVIIMPSALEFVQGLRDGRFAVGITEWLLAGQLAARNGWSVVWMPAELPRYPVALGLWKGDLTLKRAIVDEFETLRRDGKIEKIIARYVGEARAKGDAMLAISSENLFTENRACEPAIRRRKKFGDQSGGGEHCQQYGGERL
jgi:polar amino acid transport system substrate-binding protein/cystine transport system substrate-binding protein/membrane-bound lytic murein transglycosylase F